MKKIIVCLALFCVFSLSICAQDFKEKSQENPLDCVSYLLKIENNYESREFELKALSINYWLSNRKSDAIKTLDLIDNNDKEEKVETLLFFAEETLKANNKKEALSYLLSALKYVNNNEFDIGFDNLSRIAYDLVLISDEDSAQKLINSVAEKYFKAEFLVTMADAFQKKGQTEKAIQLLPDALKYAEESEYEKQKYSAIGSIAKKYADLGKNEIAINLFKQVEKSGNDDREFFEIIFQSYLKLELFDKAEELIKNFEKFNAAEIALKFAELNFSKSDKESTFKFLQQATIFAEDSFDKDTKLYPDDFAENVTNLLLKIDKDVFALDFAKNIPKTVPQHFSLLLVANYYLEKKLYDSVDSVLQISFEKLKDADKNQFNFDYFVFRIDGEKLSKEMFLNRIAERFVAINKYDSALRIINSIEIPYYRAGSLAMFELKQKNRKPKTDILQNLIKANSLMEQDKSDINSENKVIFWSRIANAFSEVGNKSKSLDIFAEILNRINNDENLRDDDKIYQIINVSNWYEKSNLKANKQIRESLSKIISKWKEDKDLK